MSAINALRDPGKAVAADGRVLPLRLAPMVDALPEDDLERIHAAALRILGETGVAVSSDRVAARLGAAGAHVEAARVRFPSALVEEALRQAPRELLLAARDPACDLRVGGGEGWLGIGGPAGRVVDLQTDERREPTLADVAAASRLADAVPQVGFVGPPVDKSQF